MAQPSSSHHDRERHRSERSSHHRHHRTISSTTLLLVLSLVLAVLAVMLSLPSSQSLPAVPGTGEAGNAKDGGLLSYLSPKRTQQLIQRETAVALREAEVARREAELLAGAPGGVINTPAPVPACPMCPSNTVVETVFAPAQTVIKEIVKEESLVAPGWSGARAEELLDRELRISERERDITKREENVNRREHDASRRESWIMEQLIALGNDNPQRVNERVEEEYVIEPEVPKRRVKQKLRELPPQQVIAETVYEPEIKTVVQTETITVPAPANTRRAAYPIPEAVTTSLSTGIPKTTSVEFYHETVEEEEEEEEEEVIVRKPRARRPQPPPGNWFGGW